MATGVTDYGAQAWLSAIFTVASAPSTYYLALCVDAPGVASDGSIVIDLEPLTTSGYARQSYGTGPGNWGVSGSYLTNLNAIAFGAPTVDWGLINHWALLDNTGLPSGGDPYANAGNLFAFGEFANPAYVGTTTSFTIPASGLVISLASIEPPIAL